jgi:dTMP kinase
MNNLRKKPNFITVEGIDGVGKSTVVNAMADYLDSLNYNTKIVRLLKDTPLSKKIRSFLSCSDAQDVSPTTFAFLFCASINDAIEKLIEPAHLCGKIVISDRYTLSTRVYQRESKYIGMVCDIIENQLTPDLIFVLDAPPNVVQSRIDVRNEDSDVMESVSTDVLNERRKEFLRLSRSYGSCVYRIDASGTMDQVSEQVISILEGYYS